MVAPSVDLDAKVQTAAVWTNAVKNKAGESKWSFYSGHNETEFNNIRPFLHLVRITIKSQKKTGPSARSN